MNDPRLMLHEFRVTVGAPPHDLPFCRQVTYSLSIHDEHGGLVQRSNSTPEYGALLADPEQMPWLIARALQSLFREVEGTSETTGRQGEAAESIGLRGYERVGVIRPELDVSPWATNRLGPGQVLDSCGRESPSRPQVPALKRRGTFTRRRDRLQDVAGATR